MTEFEQPQEQTTERLHGVAEALGLPPKVKVTRSSGEVDGGWEVIGPSAPDEGGRPMVAVIKVIDGELSRKIVPLEETRQLNPSSEASRPTEAGSGETTQ